MLLRAVVPMRRVVGPVEAADGVVEEEDVGTDDRVVVLVWVDSVACCIRFFRAVGWAKVPVDGVTTTLRRAPSLFFLLVGCTFRSAASFFCVRAMASRTKCSCFATSADTSKIIPVVDDDTESSPKEVEDSNVTLCVGLLLFFLASHISGPHLVAEVVVGDDEDKEDGGVRSNFDFKE